MMEKPSEPMYAVPASLLQLMAEFLADPDTRGCIVKGAILVGGVQTVLQIGPIPKVEDKAD